MQFSDPTSGNYSISFFTPSTYFGLAWTCAAILLALGALSLAAWRPVNEEDPQVNYISLGLFAASLEMAILNVFQSLVTSSSALIQIGTSNNTSAIINATRHYAGNILSTFPVWFLRTSSGYVIAVSILCVVGMKYRTSGKGKLSKYQWWAYNAFATINFGGCVLKIRESSLEPVLYNALMALGAGALVVTTLVLVVRRPASLSKLIPTIISFCKGHIHIKVNKVIFIIISFISLVIFGYIWLYIAM